MVSRLYDSTSKALLLIILLGLLLRFFMIQTPFLGTWDERFHALVSKNLITHPLKPTLYDEPILDYDHKEWAFNHIWLSKPPLPLWFMAGSMYILGVDEYSLRIPSIIWSILSVLLTFLIGKKLFGSRIGLIAAFFHAIHGMTLEVGGGRLSSDHVETAFLFFFELGLFMTINFFHEKKRQSTNVFLIGIVTGLAFMCKWIAAGFIPIIWGVMFFWFDKSYFKFIKQSALMSIGFLITTLPWIIFILDTYPIEANYILKAIFTPIGKPIQGHAQAWYHYLDNTRIVFGEIIYLPMIWLFYKLYKRPSSKSRAILVILIIVPIVLLSLMGTKRSTYILMTSVGFYVLTAVFIRYLKIIYYSGTFSKVLIKIGIVLLVILPIRYSIERIKPFKSFEKEKSMTNDLKSLDVKFRQDSKVAVFDEPNYIRLMFYHDNVVAYPWVTSQENLRRIKKEGYIIYIREKSNLEKWE